VVQLVQAVAGDAADAAAAAAPAAYLLQHSAGSGKSLTIAALVAAVLKLVRGHCDVDIAQHMQ
jgi:type I site-specific restriction-modification system R (restriction) subunit